MSEPVENQEHLCPVNTTLAVMGGKWKPLILYYLNGNTRRFNELNRLIPAVTQRVLTMQLRELENDGIVLRKVYAQVPPKVEYSLTAFGETLMPVVAAMHAWGRAYADECSRVKSQTEAAVLAAAAAKEPSVRLSDAGSLAQMMALMGAEAGGQPRSVGK
ncbi:helix-turn-helix transcriptional regulator [Conchiformibius steedae]|nr:helix-turn-helix transcriptional regulator [Conchiformibius steedae]